MIQIIGEPLNVPEEIIMDVINNGKDLNGAGYLTTWTMKQDDFTEIKRNPSSYNGQKIVGVMENSFGGLDYEANDSSFWIRLGNLDLNIDGILFTGYASDVIDVTGNSILPVDYKYVITIGSIYYDELSAEMMLDNVVFIMVDSSDINMAKYKTFKMG